MSKKSVVDLLSKGGDDKQFRIKYDNALSMDMFIELAKADGYDFTAEELKEVIRENGDTFESNGNPPKKDIWI